MSEREVGRGDRRPPPSQTYGSRNNAPPSRQERPVNSPNVTQRVAQLPPNDDDDFVNQAMGIDADEDALQALIAQGRELHGEPPPPPSRKESAYFDNGLGAPPNPDDELINNEYQEPSSRQYADPRYEKEPLPQRRRVVTNRNDEDRPQAPPPITPAQVKRTKGETVIDKVEPPKSSAKPRFNLKPVPRDPVYQRVGLLSDFVFYPFKELFARKISLPDQFNIYKAQQTRDITLLIDALGATLKDGIDIRDFTIPDFYYFLYWHRLNSYTTIPFIITWESKYGNENKYKITDTDLKYNPPTITEEEYMTKWVAEGYSVPTVREFEVWQTLDLNDEERWIFTKAQYFTGFPDENGEITIESKIERMSEVCGDSIDGLAKLEEFKLAVAHSMEETIQLTDAKFDPNVYVEALQNQIQFMEQQAEEVADNPVRLAVVLDTMQEQQAELDALKDQLEKGGEVLPDVEDVRLNLHPLDFFPSI